MSQPLKVVEDISRHIRYAKIQQFKILTLEFSPTNYSLLFPALVLKHSNHLQLPVAIPFPPFSKRINYNQYIYPKYKYWEKKIKFDPAGNWTRSFVHVSHSYII